MEKLNVKALGLAIGTLWGACVFLLGISAAYLNIANSWVKLLGDLYVGLNATFAGSALGAVYGFVDGFIGGAVIAWLYNKFSG